LKKNLKYILLLGVLFLLYLLFVFYGPRKIDWSENLSPYSTQPLGLFVFHNSVEDLFAGKKMETKHFNLYDWKTETGTLKPFNLLIFDNGSILNKYNSKKILEMARAGNTVFYCSAYPSNYILDSLGFFSNSHYGNRENIVKTWIEGNKKQVFKYKSRRATYIYFKKDDKTKKRKYEVKTKGKYNDGLINFVEIKTGKGKICIHTHPEVFANYYLLKGNTKAYVEKIMGFLPDNDVIWYMAKDSEQTLSFANNNIFGELLSNKYFFYAYLLFFALTVMFLLSEVMRLQRPVPVIESLKNTSLELIDSVSALYLHRRNNEKIAAKLSTRLIYCIKKKYRINAGDNTEENIRFLSGKSGVDYNTVKRMFGLLNYIASGNKVNDERLFELNKYYEIFTKTK